MLKKLILIVLVLSISVVSTFAQEPTNSPGSAAIEEAKKEKERVKVPAKTLDDLKQLRTQLAQAQEEEAASKLVYEKSRAITLLVQEMFNSAYLKALMAEGVTDPKKEISETPKPEK